MRSDEETTPIRVAGTKHPPPTRRRVLARSFVFLVGVGIIAWDSPRLLAWIVEEPSHRILRMTAAAIAGVVLLYAITVYVLWIRIYLRSRPIGNNPTDTTGSGGSSLGPPDA